jgi:hypothetical protein
MKTNKEKNRMILEFMGIKPAFNSFTNKWGWGNSPWFACSYDTEEEVMDAVAGYAKYDTDWSWIMPVLEKLCRTRIGDGETIVDYPYPYTFGMLTPNHKIIVRLQGFGAHVADNLIDALFEAVVEAIEYINEKK